MNQAKVIEDAIKHSGVRHIAIVDDAFDPPVLNEDDYGELLNLLQHEQADLVRNEAKILEGTWALAIQSLKETDYDNDAVSECIKALYAAYIETFDTKFDPGGRFALVKGTNLSNVRPLVSFLRSCKPELTIQSVGREIGDVIQPEGELVVFVDLYLDPQIGADTEPSKQQADAAISKSLERIKPLMAANPSVVLMSSHAARERMGSYRKTILGGKVYASRFVFVEKTNITENNNCFTFHDDVIDSLLDVFETYKFARGLNDAFDAWLKSATDAISDLRLEVEALELRDISYLVRFRLAEEGQNLHEYLEWLLGESLIDLVGEKLDQQERSSWYKYLEKQEAEKIGGAFEGPTKTVARLYHRVRIENARKHKRQHFRLGDLYVRTPNDGMKHLVAVMNPDCDLVTRSDGERNAKTLLTVRGNLENFNAPQTSVGNFIVVDAEPQNIEWDYLHIEAIPFAGAMAKPGISEGEYKYIGALRPMYAQEIQANLLNKLGRVGVAVPPALAFAASVSVKYRVKDLSEKNLDLPLNYVQCYYVPARQYRKQGGQVVFTRRFIRDLIEAIHKINSTDLSPDDAAQLEEFKKPASIKKLTAATYGGVWLENNLSANVFLTGNSTYKAQKNTAVWCWLTLSVEKWDIEAAPVPGDLTL